MSDVGRLYIVATPIGNLEDMTLRAITVLKTVQIIAAEDTRQTKKLLQHYGISTPLFSLHAHNERTHSAKIIEYLKEGQSVAYVTDAGTPLISDPGAFLVKTIRKEGFNVCPIPGPSAVIAALSVAGFTSPQFYFEGFLPSKKSSRKDRLKKLKDLESTLIFYESPHRIMASLSDMLEMLGNREGVIARELTKRYESIYEGSISDLIEALSKTPEDKLGEFVVLIAGNEIETKTDTELLRKTLSILLKELPLKQAVAITGELLNLNKNDVYSMALSLKEESGTKKDIDFH